MQPENSKIAYRMCRKEDGSYIYAEPVLEQTISTLQIAQEAAEAVGVNLAPKMVDALVSAYMERCKVAVSRGQRPYVPCNDGNGMAFYAIFDDATIKAGDKDSEGNLIPVTADALKNRAQLFKVRLGCQVSSNFADITKPAVPAFNGEVKPIRTNAPAGNGGSSQGGNGGNNPDDGTLG